MLSRLLILFIVVPVVELILLIEIGQVIGTLPTIALIFFTGLVGAFLARRQGVQTLNRLRSDLQTGKPPADAIFDGVIILVAGAFLMTPGVLTDVLGFSCLIPATRNLLKKAGRARVEKAIKSGTVYQATYTAGGRPQQQQQPRREAEDVIILDPDDYRHDQESSKQKS